MIRLLLPALPLVGCSAASSASDGPLLLELSSDDPSPRRRESPRDWTSPQTGAERSTLLGKLSPLRGNPFRSLVATPDRPDWSRPAPVPDWVGLVAVQVAAVVPLLVLMIGCTSAGWNCCSPDRFRISAASRQISPDRLVFPDIRARGLVRPRSASLACAA
ncbi:hypothetical protein [Saccharothrix coeruleofusca]|uniref:Uncharacterized protein n=1 Tax=Saccharothrix coeruleofusca TaxID=33919 RepID=A0A918EGS3_9PSEU|nr:hypothetical protein [Saccharothrix coeruleofusca]GGP71108.1 hypothetical protein GCM10010185_50180 [Saccharothrix coeruleofusca]